MKLTKYKKNISHQRNLRSLEVKNKLRFNLEKIHDMWRLYTCMHALLEFNYF
jgi:hypothetical protein